MAEKQERRGLGRGLSALLADVESEASTDRTGRDADIIAIDRIHPNPDQPRRTFSEDDMADLTASIRDRGIIQPLIVRPDPTNKGGYQIVAGERRWRAAQRAQLHEIPVLIRSFTDTEVLEVAIIENIQRSDLNSAEEALGYKQLMDRFGHTQEQLAEVLGKSRSHIANLLRLLNLPEPVLEMLRRGDLSAGHARALVPAEDPVGLAKKIVSGGLSVRAAEALVKKEQEGGATSSNRLNTGPPAVEKDADTKALEGDLSASLGMKVRLDHRQGQESGQLVVTYRSLDELDELCRRLSSG